MSNGSCLNSARNEINLVTVNVLDNHNLLLGQEMESQIADSFAQDALLEKNNIATSSDNFLHNVEDVALFFFKKAIHGCVIMNDNV